MMKAHWYSALAVLLPLIAAFFIAAIAAARSVHNHEAFSLRGYSRKLVLWLTDQFFDHVVRLHVHTSLEWVSALGLLSLLAGKVATALLFEGEITMRTTWFVGAMLVGGVYQMYAVLHRHNIQARIEASIFATAAWLFVFVSLFVAYLGESTIVARIIFEYVLPMCFVFVVISILQTLVLMRESMYPSLSREEQFAMAIFDEIRVVFDLQESLRTEFRLIVTHMAHKLKIRQ